MNFEDTLAVKTAIKDIKDYVEERTKYLTDEQYICVLEDQAQVMVRLQEERKRVGI